MGNTIAWWSPDPRGILPLPGLRVTRSLRQSCRRFEVRIDTAFAEVMRGCADPGRDGGWITEGIRDAYERLHRMGWAHSVETWRDGRLVGGLYGIAIGGFFAGESMFHLERDASKVALVGLVDLLRAGGADLLDVQWTTPHLRSLGAVDVPRSRYLELLAQAVDRPCDPFGAGGDPVAASR
jgi:leucyl/phenylalanyl-tRNA--protein transferase